MQPPLFQIVVVDANWDVLSLANKINLEHIHLLISTIGSFECNMNQALPDKNDLPGGLWRKLINCVFMWRDIHVYIQTFTFIYFISSRLRIFDYLQLLTISSNQPFYPALF